jgi:hypothetical protein
MDAKIERVQSAAVMQWLAGRFASVSASLVACLGVVTGCGRDPAAKVSEPYRSDIASLCDVVARSGADKLESGGRAYTTAMWLAANLQTQDAKDYLIRIQPLVGEPKADALEAEARRAGLPHCALADEWRLTSPR